MKRNYYKSVIISNTNNTDSITLRIAREKREARIRRKLAELIK